MASFRTIIFSVLLFFVLKGYAQIEDEGDVFTIDASAKVDLSFDEDVPEVFNKKKVKKRKRKYFYGIKTKKGFTRSGYGKNITLELFYFLKVPQEVDHFVRDVYWYDYKKRSISKSNKYNPQAGALLHGPYKRVQNNIVLDSGMYYLGTKHGTWMYHDKNDVLQDKEKYFKGWPRESRVRYYDEDRKILKEIVPVEFGEKEGYYYYFFENGKPAVTGEFKWDQKVGDWTEYHPNGRRKKVIRYAPSSEPYAHEKPYILKEWDARGKEVYDYVKAHR